MRNFAFSAARDAFLKAKKIILPVASGLRHTSGTASIIVVVVVVVAAAAAAAVAC